MRVPCLDDLVIALLKKSAGSRSPVFATDLRPRGLAATCRPARQRQQHPGCGRGRCGTRDRGRCLLFDGPRGAGAAAGRLHRRAHLAGVPRRAGAGAHGGVAVTYFEWAGPGDRRIGVPWRLIDGPEAAEAVAGRLRTRAVPARLAHLDCRRAAGSRAAVRASAFTASAG